VEGGGSGGVIGGAILSFVWKDWGHPTTAVTQDIPSPGVYYYYDYYVCCI
jgi:hypothetical protein